MGYVEPDTSLTLMLAAGLGIAKAISSKRVDKRFVGEVMDDDTVGSTQDESTDHNSNQLSSVTERKEEPEKKKKKIYKTEDLQKTYNFYFN
jgi:hypothetical protein